MEWGVWDVLWSIFVFFFWFIYIWIFIQIFADILRRSDIGGWKKAGWFLLLLFVPLFGALIYMIARPQFLDDYDQRARRAVGYSPADEITKAQALKDKGAITDAEFEELKRKALN